MNDPNKRIDVNLSSLLSLKAELLRKQGEVNKVKKQNASGANDVIFRRTSSGLTIKRSKEKAKTKEEVEKPREIDQREAQECAEMLLKSRKALEAKSKLYDRMSAAGGQMNSDDTCLVLFNHKKQETTARRPSTSSSSDGDLYGDDDDDEGLWTEYTDCLGRTRKCLKSDLAYFKEKDAELIETATSRQQTDPSSSAVNRETNTNNDNRNWYVDTKGMTSSDLPLQRPEDDDDTLSMISKATIQEGIRTQWGHKEQENLQRDEIHYQDVLFDEARSHGVGYYAFSADQQERLKQQKALETERLKTLEAQRDREKQKDYRDKIMADRIFAAKNRQRARQGLPPLTREEMEKKPEAEAEESVVDKEAKKRERKAEKEKKKKERKEEKLQEKRKHHLRPWDSGKMGAAPKNSSDSESDSDEWEYKPEKRGPMSQDEWNEKKRGERVQEFAPFVEPEPLNRFTTIKPKPFKRRNAEESSTSNMYNEPIRNELYDDYEVPIPTPETEQKRRRAEVAPPMSMGYFGPSEATMNAHRQPPPKSNANELEASIAAGLQFLRNQSDKTSTGSKQKWVSNSDY